MIRSNCVYKTRLSSSPVISSTAGGIGVSCFLSRLPRSVHGAAACSSAEPPRRTKRKHGLRQILSSTSPSLPSLSTTISSCRSLGNSLASPLIACYCASSCRLASRSIPSKRSVIPSTSIARR